MTEQDIAGTRAQIERQTIERQHYAGAIKQQTAVVSDMQAAMQPDVDRLAALEADLVDLQARIDAQRAVVAAAQQAIAPESGKLDALSENAAALDRAILGCKTLIGEA